MWGGLNIQKLRKKYIIDRDKVSKMGTGKDKEGEYAPYAGIYKRKEERSNIGKASMPSKRKRKRT